MRVAGFTEKCMKQVYADAPMLSALDRSFKNLSLSDYLRYIKREYIDKNKAPLDPVIEEAIRDYASGLIGEEETNECIRVIKKTGIIHTANHHGFNFFPMTVQGNILFEYLINLCTESPVVPVFGCTTITMSNSFYPRGLMICDTADGYPCQIPVFPYKMRKVSVSHAPAFTKEMLLRAGEAVERYRAAGYISSPAADSAREILERIFGTRPGSGERYGNAATLINRDLSEGYWTDRKSHHVFLELEEVSRRVICHDLADDNSMLSRILWNKKLLQTVRKNLKGVSGCWGDGISGTFLFWGIDQKNRSYRLQGAAGPEADADLLGLSGTDPDGKEHFFSLDRDKLYEMLLNRRLLPGLFMTFFSLGIARDSCLAGGCLQGEYLRQMSRGIKKSFEEAEAETDEEVLIWLERMKEKAFPYLCGPLFLTGSNGNSFHPLGSVELRAHPRPFSSLQKELEIPFERAQRIGLYCFYPDSVPVSSRFPGWWENISGELFL